MFSRFWPAASQTKIVLTGHQKGGTTAIAELLGKAVGSSVSIDPFYAIDFGSAKDVSAVLLGEAKFCGVASRYRRLFCRPIVKDPDFIYVLDEVRDFYKCADFVFIVRDPRDTIRSICNRVGLSGDIKKGIKSPLSGDMKGGNVYWEKILGGQLPRCSLAENTSLIEVLATRWKLAADIYLANRDSLVLVRYEDFLLNKKLEIERLAHRLNVPVVRDIEDLVDVQYQVRGDRSAKWDEFLGFDSLMTIDSIAGEQMSFFGYEKYTKI